MEASSLDPYRKQGAGACAGSHDAVRVTEEQIAIHTGDREPRDLGEAERPLFFESKQIA